MPDPAPAFTADIRQHLEYLTDPVGFLILLPEDRAAIKAALAEIDRLYQRVCDFQAAALIDVGNQGGPCRVEPCHVEAEVTRLRVERGALLTACRALMAVVGSQEINDTNQDNPGMADALDACLLGEYALAQVEQVGPLRILTELLGPPGPAREEVNQPETTGETAEVARQVEQAIKSGQADAALEESREVQQKAKDALKKSDYIDPEKLLKRVNI
jgi:hypothetical protein